MNIGDKGTVSRGRLGQAEGEIVAIDNANDKYVVKFADGEHAIVSQKRFKAPEEANLTLSALVDALNKAELSAADPTARVIIDRLNEALPGVADKVELRGSADGEDAGFQNL